MDELWQRYRTFWTPVLWGVGVFLVGLIAVHVATDDPEAGTRANEKRANAIRKRTTASATQIAAAKVNADEMSKHVQDWAVRLDQRHGDDPDLFAACVAQALKASILRGAAPGDASAFEGDAAAAMQAKARYDLVYPDKLNLLRTQDPNVGYSGLQAEVVGELEVRANRADVDVGAEGFGLAAITSVDRAGLPRLLSNLALIATVVNTAINAGVRSIDRVEIQTPDVQGQALGADSFLAEWPVLVELTGDPRALTEILTMLTNPARPTALGMSGWKQSGKKDGMVKASMRIYSLRVQPSGKLSESTEE